MDVPFSLVTTIVSYLGVSYSEFARLESPPTPTYHHPETAAVAAAYDRAGEKERRAVRAILEVDKRAEYTTLSEREAYIIENAKPFAAAHGDISSLDEAQTLYDKSE